MKPLAMTTVLAIGLMLTGQAWAAMGTTAPPLKAAGGSKAEAHIAEGIEHYNLGHMDVALKHFQAAVKDDPQSAEAHYNVALALDKTGDHKTATEHFKMAAALGANKAEIQNSGILKSHLKP